MNDSELVFTTSAVLDLLSQIDELSEYNIHLDETSEQLNITIGNNEYQIAPLASDVEIDAEALDEVAEINDETFDDFSSSSDTIESGVIKELAKTLMIGGIVRLTKKLLS